MATRSTIAMELDSGKIKQIYCHWDGYLTHHGSILLKHYSDKEKLTQLINLGSLSCLGSEIGETHDFDEKKPDPNWTTAYHRDREEDLVIHTYKNYADYQKNLDAEEFNYIFRNTGTWEVEFYDSGIVELTEALIQKERDGEC